MQTQFKVTEELLASHGQRLLNLLLDTFMQVVLFFFVLTFLVAIKIASGDKEFVEQLAQNMVAQYTIVTCIALFYYNVFEIFGARTIGKFITQTIVVDENGNTPTHETILIRSLCRLIPFNAFSFLGLPSRGWHDSISKTYVVNRKLLHERKRLFYALAKTPNEESSCS
jgi:uncharacterized RDD family membrane protein YckC